jgi:hypothetical protein
MAQPNRSTDGSPCDRDPSCPSDSGVAAAPPAPSVDHALEGRGFPGSTERSAPDDDGYRRPAPYAWQHRRQLLLLDEEPNGKWVMAELWFDTDQCRYIELRRATYDWAREALGAVLSRAYVHGEILAAESAGRLDDWYGSFHAENVTVE